MMSNANFYIFLYLFAKNVLNSDPKAKELSISLQYNIYFYIPQLNCRVQIASLSYYMNYF